MIAIMLSAAFGQSVTAQDGPEGPDELSIYLVSFAGPGLSSSISHVYGGHILIPLTESVAYATEISWWGTGPTLDCSDAPAPCTTVRSRSPALFAGLAARTASSRSVRAYGEILGGRFPEAGNPGSFSPALGVGTGGDWGFSENWALRLGLRYTRAFDAEAEDRTGAADPYWASSLGLSYRISLGG